MKLQIKKSYFLFALVFTVLVSCRTEDDLSIDPPTNETIKPNSTLANLMSRVAKKDGSKDNIIDKASNLTVQLPVTVTVNGIELEIIDEDGYDSIEAIIDLSDDDTDAVVIGYPITAIQSDFSTAILNSDSELLALTVNNENDDDIECLDFQYPITLSYFDEINEIFATLTINNDNEIFNFIEELDQFAAVTFNFPIEVLFSDNTSQIITSIQELEAVIEDADNTCDEDDDNNFDDDDCENCTIELLETIFADCTEWLVDKLKRNNTNLVDAYEAYVFVFNNDGTLTVSENTNSFNGTWQSSGTGNNIEVIINVTGLPDFNDTWNLKKINVEPIDKQVEFKIGTDRLRFESDCEDFDSGIDDTELVNVLISGNWYVNYFFDQSDETADFMDYTFNFLSDNTATAETTSNNNSGSWSVVQDNAEVLELILNFGLTDPLEELDEDWEVLEATNDLIRLKNEGNFLTFGRTPYEGGLIDTTFESILTSGDWYVNYLFDNQDKTADLVDYVFNYAANNTATVTDSGSSTDGNWSLTEGDEVDLALSLNFGSNNPLDDLSDTWDVLELTDNVLRLKGISNGNGSENFLTFKRTPFDGSSGNEELTTILSDGLWLVSSYSEDEEDLTLDYTNYELNFNSSGTVSAINDSDTIFGSWEVFSSGNQMDLNFGNDEPFREFNDNDWDVISVSDTEVVLQDLSGGGNNVSIKTLSFQKL